MPPLCEPRLPLARYRLRFQARSAVDLPRFAGSTWRGILGHALKKAVCVTHEPQCGRCLLLHACAHAYVFETPPPPRSDKMRKYTAAPHPFVLTPEPEARVLQSGDTYTLGLTLIGHGNRQLPYLIHALSQGARSGVGKSRGVLELLQVEQETTPGETSWNTIHEPGSPLQALPVNSPAIPPSPTAPVRMMLNTPLRLKRDGKPVGPDALTFADLFSNLLRRVSMLSYFHTDTPLETDFAHLTEQARAWRNSLQVQLEWQHWRRYSSRQKAHVGMDGLMGEVILLPEGLTRFWPYLWLGQFVHAGAGTTMGQGHYTLASLPPSPSTPESD